MSKRPLVTVIVPTYNRARTVGAALESVLNQTYGNVEVMVVDDGSTDGTEQVVESLRDERLVYVKQHSRTGATNARNRGISLAKGEFVAFQDSDDLWYRDKLEKQVATLTSLPKSYGMVYAYMMARRPEGDVLYKPTSRLRWRKERDAFGRMLSGERIGIGLQTCLVRRECFDEVGTFDTNLKRFIDYEFFIRFSRRFGMYEMPEPMVTYIVREDSISRSALNGIEAQKYIMEKHGEHLRRNRRALAFQHFFLGRQFVTHGDYRSAGVAFRTAARVRPEPAYILWALLSYGDGRSLELARRVKRGVRGTGRRFAKLIGRGEPL